MKKIDPSASLQTEVDASYLYNKLADAEDDTAISRLYRQMAEIEMEHASSMLKHQQEKGITILLPDPSWRARTLNRIGKIFGYEYVLNSLMVTEKTLAFTESSSKEKQSIALSGNENNHVRILENLISTQSKISGEKLSKLEGRRHKSVVAMH